MTDFEITITRADDPRPEHLFITLADFCRLWPWLWDRFHTTIAREEHFSMEYVADLTKTTIRAIYS